MVSKKQFSRLVIFLLLFCTLLWVISTLSSLSLASNPSKVLSSECLCQEPLHPVTVPSNGDETGKRNENEPKCPPIHTQTPTQTPQTPQTPRAKPSECPLCEDLPKALQGMDSKDLNELLDSKWLLDQMYRGVKTANPRPGEEARVAEESDKIVMDKLHALQSPKSCSEAKYYLCDVSQYKCGFGCQLHGVARCLGYAYQIGRTAEVHPNLFAMYSQPWDSVFEPLSTCSSYIRQHVPKSKLVKYSGPGQDAQFTSGGGNPGNYYVPPDIADGLKKYHKDPPLWFFGRMVAHSFRLNKRMRGEVEDFKEKIGIGKNSSPDYSIHVRRTDKLHSEGWYHDLGEYLYPIDRHEKPALNYRSSYGKSYGSTVYIATDDKGLFGDLRHYEQYEFKYNQAGAENAAVANRNSKGGLEGLVIDIQLCSEATIFVGTFSSQMSRIVYEIISSRYFHPYYIGESLDEGWYIGV